MRPLATETVRAWLSRLLVDNGLFPQEADAVIERVNAAKESEALAQDTRHNSMLWRGRQPNVLWWSGSTLISPSTGRGQCSLIKFSRRYLNPQKYKELLMKPAKVAKVVNFDCGCLCEFVYYGAQSHNPDSEGIPQKLDWHVVPCNVHAVNRVPGELEQRAERTYSVLVNRVENGEQITEAPEISYK